LRRPSRLTVHGSGESLPSTKVYRVCTDGRPAPGEKGRRFPRPGVGGPADRFVGGLGWRRIWERQFPLNPRGWVAA